MADGTEPAKTRVLAVDDDPEALRLVSWQLRSMGYEVVEAKSTTEALHILSLDESFDLLFTGLMLRHEVTGLELARRVHRAFGSRLKVQLTSDYL